MKNNAVPDPFYGLENETIIDIANSGREYYTFWFFTTFQRKLVREHFHMFYLMFTNLLEVCSDV